ncbi:hypothetical protein [Turicimonas muris]|uniref:hypothetical protein n=1 Tax=Turicimonas muris TaxID=1796652 RepID=UPI0024951860|nr:hypothetical protein [Turicimonas muris]
MSIKLLISSFLATAIISTTAVASENLISNILTDPDQTVKGERIVQTEQLLPQKNIDLLDMENNPIRDNPCVKINLVREQKGSLWIQQVVIEPIKNPEFCTMEASALLGR